MIGLLQLVQNAIYSVREYLWSFPEFIFIGNYSPYHRLKDLYLQSRPFSHFFSILFVSVAVLSLIATDVSAYIKINTSTYIEGAIVGVDEFGQLRKLNRISPLIVSDIQLEKDLSELIYESLINVDQEGNVTNVVVESYESQEDGTKHKFKLKKGILWHDGVELTTADVEATFKLLQELNASAETSSISSRAATNMDINVIDDYNFEFVFKENTVIPSFFEAISFKILPAHLMGDLNARNVNNSDPILNRNPIGTGPFRLQRVDENAITLRKNPNYRNPINLSTLRFNLYPNETSAVNAIRSGQVHGLAEVSIDKLREIKELDNLEVLSSGVVYNQYWALYFNLQNDVFKQKKVRQAIASGINKELLKEALLGYAENAVGPIPKSSFAFADINRFTYDPVKAKELLDEAGWKLPPGKLYREKDGKQLSFEMYYVDNIDRARIASVLQDDLAEIGIKVELKPLSLAELRDQHIIPKQFSTLLYGVQTFIDPDRYELFHSSQIEHPGLNISSYKSSREVLAVVPDPERPGQSVSKRIPEVDDILDDARKITDEDARKDKYQLFQELVAEDVPVVFLYHPRETYVINKRVKNVDISDINSIEERFGNVEDWEIRVDD